MIYILFDTTPNTNDKKWLYEELVAVYGKQNVSASYTKKRLTDLIWGGKWFQNYILQFLQIFKILFRSNKRDTIIVWYSITGVLLNYLICSLGLKRRLILMNWLTPMMGGGISYKMHIIALKNPLCTICINTMDTQKRWEEMLGSDTIKSKFCFFPDVFDDQIIFEKAKWEPNRRYVFSGGMTNRDWALIADLANLNPDKMFVICADKEDFESQVKLAPGNLKVNYNIPSEKYYDLMREAFIVFIPLKNQAASGIINVLRAVQSGVPCCITYSMSTSQYYSQEQRWMTISGDVNIWYSALERIWKLDKDEYCNIVNDSQLFIKSEFSPGKACKRLIPFITLYS